ncbi:sigma-70 family RNA polymerase sigma factor [Pseudonocardia petroleophila]
MSTTAPPAAPEAAMPLPRQRPRETAPAAEPAPGAGHLHAAHPHAGHHDGATPDGAAMNPEALNPDDASPETAGAWSLVRAAQEGDMEAFSELYDRYYDVVFRYVLFRMNDRTLAEDITQEAFVRALRRIGSVTYQGRDIAAWFVTIARNLIFDHVKSSRYRLESTTADIIDLSPSTHGPEQQVLDGATNDELIRCVRKLNPDQQECITLRFLQGLSVAETARIMDRNEGAVKALQHRAVRRLAQLLPEGLR